MATFKQLVEILQVIAPHVSPHDTLVAEHDILYLPADINQISEESEAGKKLDELGAFVHQDSWAIHT